MSELLAEIRGRIERHVRHQVAQLQRDDGEYRAVFNGPPVELLEAVFTSLVADGGIRSKLANGLEVIVPVVLQVDKQRRDGPNPPIGASGLCDADHLVDLRNATQCPRYLALVPPGSVSTLTLTSTRSDFGLEAHNNSGSASISDWWNDHLIQSLVHDAIHQQQGLPEDQAKSARALIRRAMHAANDVDEHEVSRRGAWYVLSRAWTAGAQQSGYGRWLSLACGFPPTPDGRLDDEEQPAVLQLVAERIEELSVRGAINRFREKASATEAEALEAFAQHLQGRFQALTVLVRALPSYYAPSASESLEPPPDWWSVLTTECWRRLLEVGPGDSLAESVEIDCTNAVFPPVRGLVPVVKGEVRLLIRRNEATSGKVVTVTRSAAGAEPKQWQVVLDDDEEIIDDSLPSHRTPVRYTAVADGLKPGAIRVISLGTWGPGIVVTSRTASRAELPRAPRRSSGSLAPAFQCAMEMIGEGRHYIDVYVCPDVTVDDIVVGIDDSDAGEARSEYRIGRVSASELGFEIEATSECHFDLAIRRPPSVEKQLVRLLVSCQDVSPHQCKSEYERLLLLNNRRARQGAIPDVQINRQVRSANLQTWLLANDQVTKSFYPLVLGEDYASDWRQRDWNSQADTIVSRGRFLHDPRPLLEEMVPPQAYIESRAKIAARIRGEDQNGLFEAARLGEWLATDPEFAGDIETYVRSYHDWVEASPDVAAWSDVTLVVSLEADGTALAQEPYAVLLSPLHPLRLAWHCVAQRALFLTQRKQPCPAASVLDPDSVPDCLTLALRTAAGGVKQVRFFSVESSSDYWGILWNTGKLEKLTGAAGLQPFDGEFGILVGGISSGFSVSQVERALSDMAEMLPAQPVLNVLLTSAAGQNSACNDGLLSWCWDRFAPGGNEDDIDSGAGPLALQVIDERRPENRPGNAEISNIAEDTRNSVSWYWKSPPEMRPDIAIIAQLETTNAQEDATKLASAVSGGGLLRARVRQQLGSGEGAFLLESRTGGRAPRSTGDALSDRVVATMLRLENLSDRCAYTFAPSVPTIQEALNRASFAAVSSAAIDPACFLGGWLKDAYLWDYDLPSYSSRAGDSNGYYLLSRIKEVDREGLGDVLRRLPGCKDLGNEAIDGLILEVARRGIPTVRGLASGTSGASGDLGLFVAARLLQDEFRGTDTNVRSLLPVWQETEDQSDIALVVPVDPFRGYVEDLGKSLGLSNSLRPDLVVAWIRMSSEQVLCKLTPVEVKFRGTGDAMPLGARKEALGQPRALSSLFASLKTRASDPDAPVWKVAFQHLLVCILNFGFRVYSQQLAVAARGAAAWAERHSRVVAALLGEEIGLEVDEAGRLIVIDASTGLTHYDLDGDSTFETIVLSHASAASVVRSEAGGVYAEAIDRVGTWGFPPRQAAGPKAQPEGQERIRSPVTGAPGAVNAPGGESPALSEMPAGAPLATPSGTTSASVDAGQEDSPATPLDGQPVEPGGVLLEIGQTLDTFRPRTRVLDISSTDLNQLNMGVVGDLGTGKTQLLKSLIYQLVGAKEANFGVRPRALIFDYKRDYSAGDFVAATGARVVKPYRLPLNPFDLSSAGDSINPRLDRFKFFSDVLDKLYSGIGPVQRDHLKTAVMRAYSTCSERAPTIYDVHTNYQVVTDGKADAVSSIIGDLVDMEMFIPSPADVQPFGEFLDGVVVISLDALGQDDRSKNMLVAIMLNMFYEYMLRMPKRPYRGMEGKQRTIDSFLLVDEADNIMRYEFDVLRKLLLQGREFGVGVILASQYLRHFKAGATDYKEPLLTWFIHKVPNVLPQELGALGMTGDVTSFTSRIKSLAVHQCLFKTFGGVEEIVRGAPFFEVSKK